MTARVDANRLSQAALRILRGPFLKNIAVLASGTAMAQVLTVLAYPILMRLFTPDQFGLFALFGALNMTFVVVASGRYELAIVMAKSETEAANILALSLGIVVAVSIASGLAVWAFGDPLLDLLGYQELSGLLWFLPLLILTNTAAAVLAVWATRHKQYKRISMSTISRSFGVAAAQMAAGLVGMGVDGLVLGLIFGTAMGALIIAWQIIRHDLPSLRRMVTRQRMKQLAVKHRDFPLYSMPQALLSSTTITVPSILLTALFSPYVAGLYWFTYRLFEMPITLLGDAVRRVFYQRAAEMFHKGEDLSALFLRTTGGLAAMVALPVLVMIALGPWLYAFAFGEAWRDAGYFAQWIVVWWAMRFISLPALMLVPVLNLQRRFLILEVLTLIPRFLVLPMAAWIADVEVAIAAYSVVGFLFHFFLVVLVWRAVQDHRATLAGATPTPA
ncbi:oligosaccharide flippase family protein [Skermanella rosea]|uniref:lipopolysaccharide biosynthesis protein n=1 Tax=Skermanella rosea TaxID=1817965 RepID=UPI00193328C6|nr:oligosaccharide flippase family protein [Skermanella rosea]UEM04954.1 oligosaccharide flippase family protein [Skermanella rosea]